MITLCLQKVTGWKLVDIQCGTGSAWGLASLDILQQHPLKRIPFPSFPMVETGGDRAQQAGMTSVSLGPPGPGTSVMQVMASDADDPTYGSSARLVYSVLDGEQHFTVDPKTGEGQGGAEGVGPEGGTGRGHPDFCPSLRIQQH